MLEEGEGIETAAGAARESVFSSSGETRVSVTVKWGFFSAPFLRVEIFSAGVFFSLVFRPALAGFLEIFLAALLGLAFFSFVSFAWLAFGDFFLPGFSG